MMHNKKLIIRLPQNFLDMLQVIMNRDMQTNISETIRRLIVKEFQKQETRPTSTPNPVGRPRKDTIKPEDAEDYPPTIPDPLHPGQFINAYEVEKRRVYEVNLGHPYNG